MRQLSLIDAPSSATASAVYYATDGYLIKIGLSGSPRRRGGELRAQMLYTVPGGRFEEARHHRMWAKNRIGKSEWFRPTDDMLLWLIVNLVGEGRTKELGVVRHMVLALKRGEAA